MNGANSHNIAYGGSLHLAPIPIGAKLRLQLHVGGRLRCCKAQRLMKFIARRSVELLFGLFESAFLKRAEPARRLRIAQPEQRKG